MQLTDHFSSEELKIPTAKIGDALGMQRFTSARCACVELMEPIRANWGKPIVVTSGYRSPEENARVGGAPDSYHLYEDGKVAIDFDIPGVPIEEVFDWIRLESHLPFDSVILELKPLGPQMQGIPDIIHIQMSVNHPPRRLAFLGDIHGMQHGAQYLPKEVNA